MAISNTEPRTGTCRHCEDEHPIETAVGQFCSEACKRLDRADKALSQLRSQHYLCGTCGGQLKEITPPDEDWQHEHGSQTQVALNHGGKYHNVDGAIALDATDCEDIQRTATDAVIGFEDPTDHAAEVVKETEHAHGLRQYRTGIGCVCGATDHSSTDDLLREADPARVLANYVQAFRLLERKEAIHWRLDKDAFFETYRETRDFELALGTALNRPD
ncbi:hypothetical protein [Natrarchaeobaculum sulfurireducens]|uniref:Uncharacterized protein n=1 Tax=Natrarchaeobaculum sulfurireducens TaxID=2044521 RepID=A0A346PHL1_9EURY|nr:hypothetical protein [Natrarchaeobaculum sulfurireducens]AXR79006.1 hypothetical protein AArc1_2693 [Natrarchaeobaculum sulfurireducens]